MADDICNAGRRGLARKSCAELPGSLQRRWILRHHLWNSVRVQQGKRKPWRVLACSKVGWMYLNKWRTLLHRQQNGKVLESGGGRAACTVGSLMAYKHICGKCFICYHHNAAGLIVHLRTGLALKSAVQALIESVRFNCTLTAALLEVVHLCGLWIIL